MALVLADRVRDTTTTTGTGTVTLSGTAPTGYQNFSAVGNGNTTYYTIAGGSEWEVGIGTYTASGTTLSRDTVLASSAGGTTKVTFSAGTKDVFVTYPAERSVNLSSSALTSGRVPYATTSGLLTDASGFSFSGTALTFPTPFTLGATSVTTTGTQFNYLNAATGTTGTTSSNLVFSASPTLTGAVSANNQLNVGAGAAGSFMMNLTSAAATNALYATYVGGTRYAIVGSSGGTDSLIVGDALGEFAIRSENKAINFSTNAGGSICARFGTDGSFLVGTTTNAGAGKISAANGAVLGGALTYGGVTLSNAVTGTGNMVLSASPTLTGTLTAATANFSGQLTSNSFIAGTTSAPDGGNVTAYTTGASSSEVNIVCASGTSNKESILNFGSTLTGSTRYSGRIYYRNTDNTLRIWTPTTTSDALTINSSGNLTLNNALIYGGVTLSNSVTGTGSMVLSASPTLTGNTTFYKSSGTAEPQIRLTTITDSQATQFAIGQGNGATSPFTIRYYNGSAWGDGAFAAGSATFSGALTYGGVTLSNSVTGTGSMVLSASPTLTGLLKINNGSGNSPGGSFWIEDNNGITYSSTVENTPTATIKNETGGANRVVTLRLSARDSGGGLSNWNISSVGVGSNLGALTFQNGANERGRFGSDGSFLVGTTTNGGWGTDAKIEAQTSTGAGVSGYGTGSGGQAVRARADTDTTDLLSFYRTTYKAGSFISTGGATPNIQWLANNEAYVFAGGSGGVKLTSGATAWASASDETLKTDLVPIQSGAEKVSSLRAMTGRYKTDAEGVSRSFLIAQDVQAVLPEAVSADADGILSLRYTEVIPLLVAAIKELNTRLEALEGN
jgi:hypothetical protein